MPGRRVEVSHHDAKTTPHRHPGLAPGPRLVPGPIQKGRDLNTTPVGCFLDPEYRWGDFGTTDGGIPPRCKDDALTVIPGYPRDLGLPRDLIKKATMQKQPSSRHPGLVPGPI